MPNTGRRNGVIIIGAGVAGLTAGSYLARKGFHVRVLEANPKIGGCCGATEIEGCPFNLGAQYLIYPKLLDLAFSQLGFKGSSLHITMRLPVMLCTRLCQRQFRVAKCLPLP